MKSVIDRLADNTSMSFSARTEVQHAFKLGLWYKQIPGFMLDHTTEGRAYSFPDVWRESEKIRKDDESNSRGHDRDPDFHFLFFSDTGDSWHEVYRAIRALGWTRVLVDRQGGILQYLFEIEDSQKPEGYQLVQLHLQISIKTCKQVVVGTKMVEVEITETVCDDLKEVEDPAADRTDKQAMADVQDDNPHPFEKPQPIAPGDEQHSTDNLPTIALDDLDELQNRRYGSTIDDDTVPF